MCNFGNKRFESEEEEMLNSREGKRAFDVLDDCLDLFPSNEGSRKSTDTLMQKWMLSISIPSFSADKRRRWNGTAQHVEGTIVSYVTFSVGNYFEGFRENVEWKFA